MKKNYEDSWMASFHVRVCYYDYEKLQVPDIWPMGWKCRDFIRRRPRTQPENSIKAGGQGTLHDPALLSVGDVIRVLQDSQLNNHGGQH